MIYCHCGKVARMRGLCRRHYHVERQAGRLDGRPMNATEAAAHLGIARTLLYHYIAHYNLPRRADGQFDPAQLDQWKAAFIPKRTGRPPKTPRIQRSGPLWNERVVQ